MPQFKIGDKISNGKIQYTVLDIQTNCNGDLCYVFKHPMKNNNFIWVSEEVDKSFVLVPTNSTNSDSFNWQSFRAEAAKDILCAIISQPNLGYYGDEVESAVIFADKLIAKLK